MNRFILLLLAALTSYLNTEAQTVVRGTVFDDLNSNSKFDTNEKGIRGVGVSNGTDVVTTDAQGKYELPASDPMVVFVIKPSGYAIPVNDSKLPQFYYIHKPSGSPQTKFPGSAPTGKLPEAVNFPLTKYVESEKFNVMAFGDTQPREEEDIDFLKRGVVSNLIDVQDVAFGTTLGDITFDRHDFFDPVSRVISRIGIPWYHLAGNHDHNREMPDDLLATESFQAHFGPTTFSFNYGKVHFIIADNIIQSHNSEGKPLYAGGLREDQLKFIENDLALVPSDRLVVLLVHIDLFDGANKSRANRDRLFAAMSKFPNTLSLSAHTHFIRQAFFGQKDGWTGVNPHQHLNAGAICGDWWKGIRDQYNLPGTMMRDGSPQGYFMLRFDGNRYIYDYQVVHYDAPQQISLHVKNRELYANFFTGNEFSKLRCRVSGGEWKPMIQSFEIDPLYQSIYDRWDVEKELPGKRPSKPTESYHLWKAPVVLPSPDSVIEVEATDMFGRTFTSHVVVGE